MNQLTLTDHPYLYLGSLSEARRSDEAGLWRASHQCNVACKQAIEAAIRAGFNGMHLKADCARGVIAQYGFKRVGWVLANSMAQQVQAMDVPIQYAQVTALERTAWSGKAEVPPYIPVTLTAAGWADNRQTVSVPGVSADELTQLLIPVAAGTAMEAYEDSVVRCRVQAENSLTFTCEEVPAVDLTVYIVIITLA